MENQKPRTPVLNALLHELVKQHAFETLADLTETLKCAAAQLRIPYDSTRITAALRAVSRTRPLLRGAQR